MIKNQAKCPRCKREGREGYLYASAKVRDLEGHDLPVLDVTVECDEGCGYEHDISIDWEEPKR